MSEQWKKDNIDRMRKYRRDWYAKNKKHAISKIKERQLLIREWVKEYKSHLKCSRCPENHPATIQFHHIDPKLKDIQISRVAKQGWSIDRIKEEISKCVILCANCHAKTHYEQNMPS